MFIVNKKLLFIFLFISLFSLNINKVFSLGEDGNSCSANYDCISNCCFWNPEDEIAHEYYNYAKDCEDSSCLTNVYEDYKARLSSIEKVCVDSGYCSSDISEFSEAVESDNSSGYNVTIPDPIAPSAVSEYDYINLMSQSCVIAYDSNCGVFDSGMKDAILNSLTIREAISQNLLHGSWAVGGLCFDINDKNRCSDKKYTLANIKKMRSARILPSGFEIAATLLKDGCNEDSWDEHNQYKDSCHYTLSEIVNNYDNKDSELYHLVNPNWILKDVKFRSGITNADDNGGVYSAILTSTGSNASAYRNTYVPDIESCLEENDSGQCLAWGYCIREKNVWRFDGDTCDDKYSSCKQYNIVESDGSLSTNKYYLADTLDNPDEICDSSNAGCSLYYYSKEDFNYWDLNKKIYLNDNISSCSSSSEGCSSFIKLSDVNYVVDSSFELNNSLYWDDISSSEKFSIRTDNPFSGSKYLRIYNNASYNSSEIYLTSNKTYTLSYYVKSNSVNDKFYIDIVDDLGNYYKPSSYDSTFSDFWTRKTYTFSTLSGISYIKLVITSSDIVSSGYADFDSISILDGVYIKENLPDYHTYSDSTKVYYKKAPSYMNCYDSDPNNNYILNGNDYCNYFMKTCDEMDVGCKKFYENSSLTGNFVPAKANNNTLCPSECVGYSTYVESAPSYYESGGSTMRNFIASTAVSCSASVSGCSEYINIENNIKSYFSDIKQCIKPVDADSNDNFFTYQGSSEEGYKMDVYDLRYFEESGFKDLSFGVSECTSSIYESHYDPDCREFHGLENPDDPEYSLFYANYSDIIHISASCGYYKISDNISRTVCDNISILPQYVRYGGSDSWNGVCVIGIYEEESQSCSASSSGCREYRGTDSASSEIFRDVFESGDSDFEDWESSYSPEISNESLYLNGHSIEVSPGESITKDLSTYELNTNSNNNYKLSLYAKSNKFDGSSVFSLKIGNKEIEKTISNQWTSIVFDPFFNSDIAINPILTIENKSDSSEIYFDFIILKESNFKYLIKDSWVTPISCDNKYSNPLGYDEISEEYGVRNDIGEMLNCATYYDSSSIKYNLKFDSTVLCDVSKVGCEAVFDTYNSSDYASSSFSGEGGYDTSFSVPEDEIKYFVLDSAFSCSSSQEGCSAIGKSRYASSYIVLDPDKFLPSQDVLKPILCNESSSGCREFRVSGGGVEYYKKPTSEVVYNSYEDIIFTNECEYKENVMVSNSYNGITYEAFSISGWFKKGSTLGCSFDPTRVITDPLNYKERYNGTVGLCNSESISCTVLTDPTEKTCEGGTVLGMVCNTDQDCGINADCIEDAVTGNSFCGVSCTVDSDCNNKFSTSGNCELGTCIYDLLEDRLRFNKNNSSCFENYDCGFGGICESVNNYAYKNISNMTSCTVASKVDGCMLFNDHSNSNLYWSSELTYSTSGTPQDAGTLGNYINDSNKLLQVEKDRECAEWMTFDGNFSPSLEKDKSSDSLNLGTCIEFNSDYSSCLKAGPGYNTASSDGDDFIAGSDDVHYLYRNKLEGKWSDFDFSGFAIPGYPSFEKIISSSYWWENFEQEGENIIINFNITSGTTAEGSIDNYICKRYPEIDSPFNFSDKYIVESDKIQTSTNPDSIYYADYVTKSVRNYFSNVNSNGEVISYINTDLKKASDIPIYEISDQLECYYYKTQYKNYTEPNIYFGADQNVSLDYSRVCDEVSSSESHGITSYFCGTDNIIDNGTEGHDFSLKGITDFSENSSYRQGYCLEYDLSREIYFEGSGKYNCITWVPGFFK